MKTLCKKAHLKTLADNILAFNEYKHVKISRLRANKIRTKKNVHYIPSGFNLLF
ncbi:hypothetical protein QE382_003987 [Sphingobacterium zeae]|uniref:Uncharacterized protein n=1 Tax=Sphingobacterium zeae TaxID=1776859 RepID=A0ABU0UAW3_9SPHI|nr:hypothetical protein [Sphingobacterium zeae]